MIKKLEEHFEVTVITQNVDNLHEKASSSKVIHLHGELFKVRSTLDENLVYELDGWELKEGDKCEKGSQLRPHIVWFGELVPMMDVAAQETKSADIFLVVGTSLAVYPAASLLDLVPCSTPKFIIDPHLPITEGNSYLHLFEEMVGTSMPKVRNILIEDYL